MKTERLQLRVTEETKKALEKIAQENCRSISAQIEYWIKAEYKSGEEVRGRGM